MAGRPYVETLVFLGGISADVRAFVQAVPEGGQPMVWAEYGAITAGGRAAMAAVGAARLGRRFVDLVGCVGDDLLGESIIGVIKDAGVSVRLVDRLEGAATGVNQVVVDGVGRRSVVGVSNANSLVGETQMRRADSTIFGADLLFATLEVPLATVRRAVTTAAARAVPVMLNAAPVPTAESVTVLDKALLANVDVLLTNYTGAVNLAEMNGTAGPAGVELAQRLLTLGPKAVVITLGEHGSMIAVPGKHSLIEPVDGEVIDASAGGDAYAAAFAVALTSQSRGNYRWEQLLAAGRFAAAASSLAVGTHGTADALPTRQDVEALVASVRAARRTS